MKMAKQH